MNRVFIWFGLCSIVFWFDSGKCHQQIQSKSRRPETMSFGANEIGETSGILQLPSQIINLHQQLPNLNSPELDDARKRNLRWSKRRQDDEHGAAAAAAAAAAEHGTGPSYDSGLYRFNDKLKTKHFKTNSNNNPVIIKQFRDPNNLKLKKLHQLNFGLQPLPLPEQETAFKKQYQPQPLALGQKNDYFWQQLSDVLLGASNGGDNSGQKLSLDTRPIIVAEMNAVPAAATPAFVSVPFNLPIGVPVRLFKTPETKLPLGHMMPPMISSIYDSANKIPVVLKPQQSNKIEVSIQKSVPYFFGHYESDWDASGPSPQPVPPPKKKPLKQSHKISSVYSDSRKPSYPNASKPKRRNKSVKYRSANNFLQNIKMEYGFQPLFEPSPEIDMHGNLI